MVKNLEKQIESSDDFFDIICSSKDCCPELKKNLLKKNRADTVFYPKTKFQVAKILTNYPCVIRGGASSFLGQVIPDNNEKILDMSRFDSIQILGDSIVVGAGVPFINIIKVASLQGMELKVLPMSYRSATPAGFLCNNGKVGIGSPENGDFSDSIEELEIITPNSEILKIKGNDIKDFSGSEGMLGAISSVKLKLQPKKQRYTHMYGFDERIDLEKFFYEIKGIRFAYFFNDVAASFLNKKWNMKSIPKYTMIVQDTNDNDDYKREFREDLSRRGVSLIYPKWVLELEFARINMIEFMIKEDRNNLSIGDSIGSIPNAIFSLKYAEKYQIPVFGTLGKDSIMLRYYANLKDGFDKNKFLSILNIIYKKMHPYSKGRFFQSQRYSVSEYKRLVDAKSKYNITKNLKQRDSLNNNIFLKKIMSPIFIATGGKLW